MLRFFLLTWWCFAGPAPFEVPTSARSRAAIARVKPDLIRALDARDIEWGARVYLRVFKAERVLELWIERGDGVFGLFKRYPICALSGELGPKRKQGDLQGPEGFYSFGPASMNPWSDYHLSFNIGYPNAYDRSHGYTGSYIMVHGNCASLGCFAMRDGPIEDIYALVDAAFRGGQANVHIDIFPFKMEGRYLALFKEHVAYPFWQQLKPGFDQFEKTHVPPDVRVVRGRYVVPQATALTPDPSVR